MNSEQQEITFFDVCSIIKSPNPSCRWEAWSVWSLVWWTNSRSSSTGKGFPARFSPALSSFLPFSWQSRASLRQVYTDRLTVHLMACTSGFCENMIWSKTKYNYLTIKIFHVQKQILWHLGRILCFYSAGKLRSRPFTLDSSIFWRWLNYQQYYIYIYFL